MFFYCSTYVLFCNRRYTNSRWWWWCWLHNARVLRHRIQPNCKLRSLHTRWLDSWTRPPKSGAASRNPFFICGHVVLVPHAQLVTDVTSVAIKLHGKNGAHSVCSFTQEDKNDFWFLLNRLNFFNSLQCFDTVGCVTGRASDLWKVKCWFVGGDDLTAALHVL